jgi:hypothetical protein
MPIENLKVMTVYMVVQIIVQDFMFFGRKLAPQLVYLQVSHFQPQ